MLVQLTRFTLILATAIGGYRVAIRFGWPGTDNNNLAIIIYMILGSGIGYVAGGILGRRLTKTLAWVEDTLQGIPLTDFIMGSIGLVAGLVISFLLTMPLAQIEIVEVRLLVITFVYIVFVSLGVRLGRGRSLEFGRLLNLPEGSGRAAASGREKLLDTNILIDGRILEILEAGFVDGILVVPRFVLEELHQISDSADALKRDRGRRGLDILNQLRAAHEGRIRIAEADYSELMNVDAKLVRMARDTGAAVMTNDYNLNKVAGFEGVDVLNINALANAVKPAVLPGEEMEVKIVHEGKESGQGVGYLDDGTMVVVEGGGDWIGEIVDLKITRMLQTSAGKMIFSRIKTAETA